MQNRSCCRYSAAPGQAVCAPRRCCRGPGVSSGPQSSSSGFWSASFVRTAATSTCSIVAVPVAPGAAEGRAPGDVAAGLEDLKIADMMLPKMLMVVLLLRLAFDERPLSQRKRNPARERSVPAACWHVLKRVRTLAAEFERRRQKFSH